MGSKLVANKVKSYGFRISRDVNHMSGWQPCDVGPPIILKKGKWPLWDPGGSRRLTRGADLRQRIRRPAHTMHIRSPLSPKRAAACQNGDSATCRTGEHRIGNGRGWRNIIMARLASALKCMYCRKTCACMGHGRRHEASRAKGIVTIGFHSVLVWTLAYMFAFSSTHANAQPSPSPTLPPEYDEPRPWAAGVSESEQAIALELYVAGNLEFTESRFAQALAKYKEAIRRSAIRAPDHHP